MIEYYDKDKVHPGMLIKATGFRDREYNITLGLNYRVVEVCDGIFSSRPYVRVINDTGKPSGCLHLSRFSFIGKSDE